jgi:hypothetical protein
MFNPLTSPNRQRVFSIQAWSIMSIIGSYFKNQRDSKPQAITFSSWSSLVDLFREYAQVPRDPDTKSGVIDPNQPKRMCSDGVERDNFLIKPSTPAICPAQYADGAKRAKANVVQLGWFAADCDDLRSLGLTPAGLSARLAPYNFVIHTTTKSRRADPRVRIIHEISRPILAREYPHFWFAYGQFMGAGLLDEKTKDASRLSFVPADWAGSDVEFFSNINGQPLDVDALLAAHPFTAPNLPNAPRPLTEIMKLSRALAASAAKRRFNFDPTVLPPWVIDMLDKHKADGRFFRALRAHAKHCLRNGYAITPDELFDAVHAYYRTSSKAKPRPNELTEAVHALDYATQTFYAINQNIFTNKIAALAARF